MKVWVDDERPAPEGWVFARSASEAIGLLKVGELYPEMHVEEISLDHDLGHQGDPEETGYTVLLHIERRVFENGDYDPPKVSIHSANSGARPKMELAIASIQRLLEKREEEALKFWRLQ